MEKGLVWFFLLVVLVLYGSCGPAPCNESQDCPSGFFCDRQVFVCVSKTGACRPGSERPCFTGPENAVNVGECQLGKQTCTPQRNWGTCLEEVTPVEEVCDERDNDCDGTIDNGCTNTKFCRAIDFQKSIRFYHVRHKEKPYHIFVSLTFRDAAAQFSWPAEVKVALKRSTGEVILKKQEVNEKGDLTLLFRLLGRIPIKHVELMLLVEAEVRHEDGTVCAMSYLSPLFSSRCPEQFQSCNGICESLNDVRHCGGCGLACPSGRECCKGKCREPIPKNDWCGGRCEQVCLKGRTCCDDPPQCVDLQSDSKNCGKCGQKCTSNELCCDGKCISVGRLNCGACGKRCEEGKECCRGDCASLLSHRLHCGQCGEACPNNQVCVQASCEPCRDGTTFCGKKCVDLKTDASNCGACGKICAGDRVCRKGKCTHCVMSQECPQEHECREQRCRRIVRTSIVRTDWFEGSPNTQGELDVRSFVLRFENGVVYAYVVGQFRGDIELKTSFGNKVFLSSLGGWDIFLAKIAIKSTVDPNSRRFEHRLVWLEQIGGKGEETTPQILKSPSGVIVSGAFGTGGHSTSFLRVLDSKTTRRRAVVGEQNGVFVAEINANKTLRWVTTVGGGKTHRNPRIFSTSAGGIWVAMEISDPSKTPLIRCNQNVVNGVQPMSGAPFQWMRLKQDGSCLQGSRPSSNQAQWTLQGGFWFAQPLPSSGSVGLGVWQGSLKGTLKWGGSSVSSENNGASTNVALGFLDHKNAQRGLKLFSSTVLTKLHAMNSLGGGLQLVGEVQTQANQPTQGKWLELRYANELQQTIESTKLFQASGPVSLRNIVTNGTSTVFLGGTFEGTLVFDNGLKWRSIGKKDAFVARFAWSKTQGLGPLLWAVRLGGFRDESIQHLAFRGGILYVLGTTTSQGLQFDRRNLRAYNQRGTRATFLWQLVP